ncbi:phage tail fiber protein [Lichenicoccus sp.]|uniref:phage tail fiber protein n=1 Tax=Lichenicoccus sp. TaxID=2781899 RepID=UPI003D1175FA
MASFFSGWIGYGIGLVAGSLQEPSDPAYGRRAVHFSVLENGVAFDTGGGTVGPSSANWGFLTYAALFDDRQAGNLLLSCPLLHPVNIHTGATFTSSPGANFIIGLGFVGGPGAQGFPAGTLIGLTPDGRQWTTGVAVQISGGVLSAQVQSFGSNVTMANLPSQSPTSGTGALWNNGGIIAVA